MAKDNTALGKAFEYACLLAIYNALKDNQPIAIETSPQFQTAKSFYDLLEEGKQKRDLDCASKGAVRILMGLEPQLSYAWAEHITNEIVERKGEQIMDLINRGKLLNEIQRGICNVCKRGNENAPTSKKLVCASCDVGQIKYRISMQPTADAVEVVRCKDCRWRGDDDRCPQHSEYVFYDGKVWNTEVNDFTVDNGFCQQGERCSV